MIAEFEATGKTVRSLRYHPNGAVDLLTEHLSGALNDSEAELWDIASAQALPRAERA